MKSQEKEQAVSQKKEPRKPFIPGKLCEPSWNLLKDDGTELAKRKDGVHAFQKK